MNIELLIFSVIVWCLAGMINILHFSIDINELKPEYQRWAHIRSAVIGGPLVWVFLLLQGLVSLCFHNYSE